MINKRLFGTPIQGDVRKKLETRQKVAGEIAPGESLDENDKLKQYVNPVFPDKNGDVQAYLSSQTPFVRMWTSLKLIKPEELAEASATEISKDEIDSIGEDEAFKRAKKITKDPTGVEYTNTAISEIRDEDGNLIKIIIKDEKHRDQVDYVRKTYIIGDYNYQTAYGTPSPNDSVGLSVYTEDDPSTENVNEQEQVRQAGELLFPQRLKTNPLLKPQAGITGMSSETSDSLGVIKTTTVNFVVHNFYDFDRIYNKYFLKPGATIFVDFGWSGIENLYNPEDLLNSVNTKGGVQEYLYGESNKGQVEGQITKYQGELEVIQGVVTDYNAKILENGSVECSVTVVSSNSVLLNSKTDDEFNYRLKSILTRGVLFYGIGALAAQSKDQETINTLLSNPKSDDSIENIDEYNEFITNKALLKLANTPTPSDNSIKSGVYVDNLNVDNVYISWGLFEDLIINSQFAFGKNQSDISNGTGFQIRMDSSNSMTKWSELYVKNQTVLLQATEEPPMFLFPEWWNTSDPKTPLESGGGSYSYLKNKWPDEYYLEKYDELTQDQYTTQDKKLEMIPIREVFINVDMIIEAFNSEEQIRKVINRILSDLNDSSPLFNWQMRGGETDSQVEIVDVNMVEAEVREKLLVQDDEERYFTFDIMSPNSIVKDYNFELKIPGGDIGNYYAIQATSHDNNLFSVDTEVKTAINTLLLEPDSKSIIYEPDNGGYRAEQNIDKKSDSEAFDVFETLKPLIKGEVITSARPLNTEAPKDDPKALTEEEKEEQRVAKNRQFLQDRQSVDLAQLQKVVEKNEQNEMFKGNKIANSLTEYYDMQIFTTDVSEKISDLMPYNLSLTTYGIGSIQPGDTFKVNYLPKIYLENSYVQAMKVTHNVGSDGWYTTLDTQFRTKIENHQKNINNAKSQHSGEIYLSSKVLSRLNLNEATYNYITRPKEKIVYTEKDYSFKYLEPFMTKISVDPYYINEDDTYSTGILIKFKTPKFKPGEKPFNLNYFQKQSLYAEFLVQGDPVLKNGKVVNEGSEVYVDAVKIVKSYGLKVNTALDNPEEDGEPINPRSDYGKIFVNKTKNYRAAHKAYPPSVSFRPESNYELLIIGQNFAVFDIEAVGGLETANKLKKFFAENDSTIKTTATRKH